MAVSSLSLFAFWKAGRGWHFLSCATMCLGFTGIGLLLSMKAGFRLPARRAGSLIHHISWVCWIQLKSASTESVSAEQAALEKGQLKMLFASDSCWCLGSGRDRDVVKAHSPPPPHNLIVQLSSFPRGPSVGNNSTCRRLP